MRSPFLYRVGRVIATALPRRLGLRLAERIADSRFRRASADRRAVRANLQLVTGWPLQLPMYDLRVESLGLVGDENSLSKPKQEVEPAVKASKMAARTNTFRERTIL